MGREAGEEDQNLPHNCRQLRAPSPGPLTGAVINLRPRQRSLFANWCPASAPGIYNCPLSKVTICPSFSGDLLLD